MTTRILLVRAVNVGGAKLPMAEFRTMLAELGAEHVRTYIQSGNAVVELSGHASEAAAFDRSVENAMKERYGYFREVISRSPAELKTALEQHPFEVIEPRFSYIVPLTAMPSPEAVEKAHEVKTGDDRWSLIGADIHARYANGAGRAELDMNKVFRRLGVQGTARNLNTIQKLIELAAKD
jgi:uncharacterized protein (DUF1697 family)